MTGNKERAILPLLLLTLVLGIIVGLEYRSSVVELRLAKHEYVYHICSEARLEVSGESEQACGDAQDRTGTEFLCEKNNQDPSTVCWVEER